MSSEMNPDAEIAYGAGEIDPVRALNPGLIYDANADDYIRFLCGQGFNTTTLQLISGDYNTCSNSTHASARDLNYPSFSLKAPSPKHHLNGSFLRTVTNIGLPVSTYKALVTAPKGLTITVNPNAFHFTSLGEKKTFVLNVDGSLKKAIESASLIWDCGEFKVRSPIVVYDSRAEKGVILTSTNSHIVRNVVIIVGSSFLFVVAAAFIFNCIVTKCRERNSIV